MTNFVTPPRAVVTGGKTNIDLSRAFGKRPISDKRFLCYSLGPGGPMWHSSQADAHGATWAFGTRGSMKVDCLNFLKVAKQIIGSSRKRKAKLKLVVGLKCMGGINLLKQ